MIVVADSSPIVALLSIDHIDALSRLFGQVIIPPEIARELNQSSRPKAVRDFIPKRHDWLLERVPTMLKPILFT